MYTYEIRLGFSSCIQSHLLSQLLSPHLSPGNIVSGGLSSTGIMSAGVTEKQF